MAELLRIYLDTSVWSFPFHDDAPERRDVTKEFFDQVRADRFDVYLSDLVVEELQAAPELRRTQLLGLVREISPTAFQTTLEARQLTREFLAAGVVPARFQNDARHIAIALVNECDVVLSWNFKHIVNLKTRRLVNDTSRMLGYGEIEICTPREVLFDDSD